MANTNDVITAAAEATEAISNNVSSAGITRASRLKSWPMWTGIISALWVFLTVLGVPAQIGITSETFNVAVSAAGTVLTLLGVVVNPTTTGVTD